jgi:hypothetical protein
MDRLFMELTRLSGVTIPKPLLDELRKKKTCSLFPGRESNLTLT